MKNRKLLICLILFICINLTLTACTREKLSNTKAYSYDYYNDYTYKDHDDFNFSFKYPDTWRVEELANEYGVELFKLDEADPKSTFTIYQSVSPLYGNESQEDLEKEEYNIEDNIIGTIYYMEEYKDIMIYIIYNHDGEESFTNALLKLDKMFYKKNIDEIWSILGSVK